MTKYFNEFLNFLKDNEFIIQASIVKTVGSSPRNADTEMFISDLDSFGTVGGGQLEYLVINHSRKMLIKNIKKDILKIPLGPEIGQCCGGNVEVSLVIMTKKSKTFTLNSFNENDKTLPHVYVLGSGHVGRALALQLQHLPVKCILIDSRSHELEKCDANVEKRLSAIPEIDIKSSPAGSAYIILSHDHALDFILCAAALERNDANYVGMIGSKTKKTKFKRWYQSNFDNSSIEALTCPIGSERNHDKRPSVIASFVTAEVIDLLTSNINSSNKYDLNLRMVVG
tara:strand:+ start:8128 stop:8979 length:852 start_codon:yes stop_codon:yes gene_type:complete